jgi:U4/U6.U5 tri-snRNP-associated protein 1
MSDLFISAVPQMAEFLETQPLSKGKTEKQKKKKEAAKGQSSENGLFTVPAPSLHLTSNGEAPGSGTVSGTGSPAPSMKPGFSRIGSAVDSPAQRESPAPAERSKLAFGFGVKRKAGEEPEGSPPSKRRES